MMNEFTVYNFVVHCAQVIESWQTVDRFHIFLPGTKIKSFDKAQQTDKTKRHVQFNAQLCSLNLRQPVCQKSSPCVKFTFLRLSYLPKCL